MAGQEDASAVLDDDVREAVTHFFKTTQIYVTTTANDEAFSEAFEGVQRSIGDRLRKLHGVPS